MLSLFTIYRRKLRGAGLNSGQVTLTFDDGPGPATSQLLDVLDHHGVVACFCVVGSEVQKRPQLVCRMAATGHKIVNHTQNHVHPFRISAPQLHAEIDSCDTAIGSALGIRDYTSAYFRIPWGLVTPAVRKTIRSRDLQQLMVTHYDRDARFGAQDRDRITQSMLRSVRRRNGGMLVLHDGCLSTPTEEDRTGWDDCPFNRSWVPESVDQLIHELKADDFQFVVAGQVRQRTRTAA